MTPDGNVRTLAEVLARYRAGQISRRTVARMLGTMGHDLPSPPPTGAMAEISMVDDRFEPNNLTVSAGTTVTWVNRGGDWHSIASYDGSFESGKLATGEFFSVRLDVPGLYQYICKHHGMQGMMGRITVI